MAFKKHGDNVEALAGQLAAQGLSQVAIARRLKTTRKTVARWLKTDASTSPISTAPSVKSATAKADIPPAVQARILELRAAVTQCELDMAAARNAGQYSALHGLTSDKGKFLQDLSRLEQLYKGIPKAPDNTKELGDAPRIETVIFGEPADPCEYCGHQQGPGGCRIGERVYSEPLVLPELLHDGEPSAVTVGPRRVIPASQPEASEPPVEPAEPSSVVTVNRKELSALERFEAATGQHPDDAMNDWMDSIEDQG